MLKVAADIKDVKFEHATGYKTGRQHAHLRQPHLRGRVHGRRHRRRDDQDATRSASSARSRSPRCIRNINSFTLGAQSVNPKIKTKVVWVNEWFDPPKETEAAQSLINGGADVLMQNTDSSAVLQTAREERQVRLRLGQRHDRLRARRRTWPRPSSTGRRTTSRRRRTRSTATGRRRPDLVGRQGRRDRPRLDRRRGAGRGQGQGRDGQGRPEGRQLRDLEGPDRRATTARKCSPPDAVADDKFLGGINFYVKGVEGKVPGGEKK